MTNERPIPTGEGLTFEKVWAALMENREQMKETDRLIKETREETDRQMKEAREETDRQMKETREQIKKTSEQMEKTDLLFGNLVNRFGELAEHLVAPRIVERFNELGYHFDASVPNGYRIHDEKGKEKTQIDILLENGDCIMAVEVKATPRIQDISHHIKRLEILRKHRKKHHDTRKIYGAMAGAVFGIKEKQAAVEAGFYVITQSGDTMNIEIPDDFTPNVW